jgi:hypothetical protein
MSHWFYKGEQIEDVPEGTFGFIYLITNKLNNKKYVGRKYVSSTRKKPLTAKQKREGKKRQTKVTTESDWREYMGSSKPLLEDIAKYGKENFRFEILIFAETKGQTNFLEETAHHKFNVLIDPDFYNDSIGPRRYMGMKKDLEFHKKIVEIFG